MWLPESIIFIFLSLTIIVEGVDYSTRTFYVPGWDASRVQYEESQGNANWTRFLDADQPVGTGEFEDVWRELVHYKGDCRALWCRNPKAMEVGMSPKVFRYLPEAKLEAAWRCTNIFHKVTPEGGFLCLARDQKKHRGPKNPECYGLGGICDKNGMKPNCERCFDARVRYFCMREDMECRENTFTGVLP